MLILNMLGTARSFSWWGRTITIEGELDENNEPCGQGIATFESQPFGSFKGTWYKNMIHGLGMHLTSKIILTCNFRDFCEILEQLDLCN